MIRVPRSYRRSRARSFSLSPPRDCASNAENGSSSSENLSHLSGSTSTKHYSWKVIQKIRSMRTINGYGRLVDGPSSETEDDSGYISPPEHLSNFSGSISTRKQPTMPQRNGPKKWKIINKTHAPRAISDDEPVHHSWSETEDGSDYVSAPEDESHLLDLASTRRISNVRSQRIGSIHRAQPESEDDYECDNQGEPYVTRSSDLSIHRRTTIQNRIYNNYYYIDNSRSYQVGENSNGPSEQSIGPVNIYDH
ncbi:uncharacterized protein LOC141591097 [Silene latifolia]|uniref:uncharacterized protein LOC141591097 n=1 Tax=Silene latifolia TaxID=37657 RepID=UPI003D77A703